MTMREGLGGRRLVAVGAGVMLIGTLGAGPAFAGTISSGDYDYDYYFSYTCDDYKYSHYYKSGYWYEKHNDRQKDDHEPGDVRPQLPTDPDAVQDLIDRLIDLDLLDPGATLEDLIDLINNPPEGGIPGLPTLPSVPETGTTPLPTTLGATGGDSTPPAETSETDTGTTPPAETDTETDTGTTPPAETDTETDTGTTPPAETGSDSTPPADGGQSSGGAVALMSSTSRLDDPDPNDDDNKGHYRHEKRKYSYVSYHCYENTEKRHRWYDYREPGKVEATKVRTVPKGGVDTGN